MQSLNDLIAMNARAKSAQDAVRDSTPSTIPMPDKPMTQFRSTAEIERAQKELYDEARAARRQRDALEHVVTSAETVLGDGRVYIGPTLRKELTALLARL